MAAYVIADAEIHDPAEYQALTPIRHRTARTGFVSIVDRGNV